MPNFRAHTAATLAMAMCFAGAQIPAPQQQVQARQMLYPGGHAEFGPWKPYPVRTLQQIKLPHNDTADAAEDKYGGRADRKSAATGYFHTERIAGRWWMIDPLGHLYLHNAIVELSPGPSDRNKAALIAKFGTAAEWSRQTQQLLLDNGIHGAGAWSNVALLRNSPLQATHPLAYTVNLDIMSAYGRHRGGTHPVPGHQGYPNDTIFVFDPEFPAFADKYLARIDDLKDDPALVGYFSDNEIPLYRKNLDGFLALPITDPGNIAARAWMQQHNATAVTDDLRTAFLEFEADRYFQIVTAAIAKHDPHHMYLACRYTSQQLKEPVLFRAAGRYAGAISMNYYSAWQPSPEDMAMWEHEASKPFLITEFYVKAEDSGLPNHTGAGWLVHTQADRGLFYQNFVLAMLESRNCVGWHWFKYQDNDPLDPHAELSNLDSNKGIVDFEYKPYAPLLSAMRELNIHLYALADAFDSKATTPTAALRSPNRSR
jgi:hypothetical protein